MFSCLKMTKCWSAIDIVQTLERLRWYTLRMDTSLHENHRKDQLIARFPAECDNITKNANTNKITYKNQLYCLNT